MCTVVHLTEVFGGWVAASRKNIESFSTPVCLNINQVHPAADKAILSAASTFCQSDLSNPPPTFCEI